MSIFQSHWLIWIQWISGYVWALQARSFSATSTFASASQTMKRETDNTTGFSVQSIRLKMSSYMYDTESRLGSSRVFLELPDVTENSLRIASAGSCVSFLNIAMSGFYFWQAISQELKVRETSNFRCKVRWIHTIDEGSHPLPVMYAFCVSASDYS